MSTDVITTTGLELIEHLDFELVCDTTTCEAGRPPATHVGWADCGCNCLMCSPCVERIRATIKRCELLDISLRCNKCNKSVAIDSVQIEPLP